MTGPSSFKLGFRNQKPGRKVEIAQRLVGALGKLTPEEREQVWLGTLEEKTAEATAAMRDIAVLRAELRAAYARRTQAVREMCRAAEASARMHANRVGYDPARLLAGGVELIKERKPVGPPAAPERLRAERGAHECSVVLRWKRPVRRCVFLVEATTDPNGQTGWVRQTESSAAKCVLKNLEGGKLHWFRVAALNAHGTGPWSGVATLRPG